jgi:hypothetical protein
MFVTLLVIISLNNINWLAVFVMDTRYAFCEGGI